MHPATLFGALLTAAAAHGQVYQFTSPSPYALGQFGHSVAVVPDLTGDGVADLLVGAPGEMVNGFANAGRVYVISGGNGFIQRVITPPNDEADQDFGECVAGVSDVNGDGLGDILIGSPDADPDFSPGDAGRAYLYSGATGLRLFTFASPTQEPDGSFGDDVASISDLDGDGRSELLISATREDGGSVDAGRVYIFSSVTGALLATMQSPNPDFGGDFGDCVSAVPDVNGDGVADIAVGAPAENPGTSPSNCGRAYLFSGATRLLLRQFQSPGQEIDGAFGESICGVPDVNNDGFGDVVVGAPRENPNFTPGDCGRVHIYSGASGVFIQRLIPPTQQTGGNFGYSVAWCPDATGDGRPEILVGAWHEHVVSGHPGTVTYAVGPTTPSIVSATARPRTGTGITLAPPGRVHLYAGGTWARLGTWNSPAPRSGGSFGHAVAVLRMPGGSLRLVIGASGEWWTPLLPGAGRAYMIPI
jgi:hypothetical protein